jgi:hypothetical protein
MMQALPYQAALEVPPRVSLLRPHHVVASQSVSQSMLTAAEPRQLGLATRRVYKNPSHDTPVSAFVLPLTMPKVATSLYSRQDMRCCFFLRTKPLPATKSANPTVPPMAPDILHWAVYGQPGAYTPQSEPAKRRDYVKAISRPQRAAWALPLSPAVMARLRLGFTPEAMEDKWNVFTEDVEGERRDEAEEGEGAKKRGRVEMHLVRSWTGFTTAVVEMETWLGEGDKPQEEGRITGLVFEVDGERARGYTEESTKDMVREVSARRLLLATTLLTNAANTASKVCRWVLSTELPPDTSPTTEEA